MGPGWLTMFGIYSVILRIILTSISKTPMLKSLVKKTPKKGNPKDMYMKKPAEMFHLFVKLIFFIFIDENIFIQSRII
jgi:hypothetical protein